MLTLTLVLAAISGISAAAATKNVLWLPLGDSITFGCMGPTIQDCHGYGKNGVGSAGYRVPLALALSEPACGGCGAAGGGYNVSTMGTLSQGPLLTPVQWHRHEGHPGWTINMVDNILNQSLATSPTPPDLITIHLGTNDCNAKTTPADMVDRMNSLLGHIMAKAPKAQVFLADVVSTGMFFQDCIVAFNLLVPGVVKAWAAKGMQVFFVPMNKATGICGAVGADHGLCGGHQIHPSAAGYPRMASAFALAITENFDDKLDDKTLA